jgi:hypothetical protein
MGCHKSCHEAPKCLRLYIYEMLTVDVGTYLRSLEAAFMEILVG